MANCPRCGIRLLPGALACVNCDLPVTPDPGAGATGPTGPTGSGAAPPPYGAPPQQQYSPYAANPGSWPPYGAPAPVYPPPGYPTGQNGRWTTNGLAIAGLVLSILWLGGLGSLLGVVFGHIARNQIRHRPQRGAGLALAALIIGYLGIVGSIVLYANINRIVNSATVQNVVVQQDMHDAASAERDVLTQTGSYSNDAVQLRNAGFNPTEFGSNTILAAYAGSAGFCLVGAHDGSATWYLYDSEVRDLVDGSFSSEDAAKAACTVTGVGDYIAIA